MNREWLVFLACIAGLVLYLVASARTEMFTKWPWRR
jgi:hypothetical protein